MRIIRLSAVAALAMAFGFVPQASAATVLAQKGNTCSAVWETGQATAKPNLTLTKPWSLTCTDGDPSCDADGSVNGQCSIRLSACALQANAVCTPEQLTKFKVNGVAKNKFPGLGLPTTTSAGCGTPGTATLKLKGKKGKAPKPSKKLQVLINFKTTPTGKGKNALQVQCVPNPSCTALPCGGPPPPTTGCDAVCPNDPSKVGQPKQICLTVPLPDATTNSNGSDLDTGYTGISHNFPVVAGSTVKYCLSNCDGISDTQCDGTGTTGPGSQNGETFGAPLALLSGGVPVCVVNRFQPGNITATIDVSTGVGGDPTPNQINLFSDTYLRFGLANEVCPRCVVSGSTGRDAIGMTGSCSSTSRNPGASCVVDGFMHLTQGQGNQDYTLSSSCTPPTDANNPTVLNIPLPLTTGASHSKPGPNPCSSVGQSQDDNCQGGSCTATCTGCAATGPNGECIDPKGGIAQLCCSNKTDAQTGSCFPTKNGGTIDRTGRPAKIAGGEATGANGVLFAANFCIPATNATLVNNTAGLPGPGALLLPSDLKILNHTAQ